MAVMPIDPRPPRENRTRPLAGAVVSTVPLVLLPFAVNVASDNLPGGSERWAWLSWPAIIILVVLSWRLGAAPGVPPDPAPAPEVATGPSPPPSAPPGPAPVFEAPPPHPWHPRPGAWPQAPAPAPAWRPHGVPPPRAVPHSRPSRSLRWLAVPVAGTFTGLLLSQFDLIGVHAPFLAAMLIVVIAVVLSFAEVVTPLRIPRGVVAGLTYVILAGSAVWLRDSSRADLWFVAESGVILGLGVFLATRVREPNVYRRVLPGVVLALLGWCAMGVLFAIYQGDRETAVGNAAFFAGLSTVVAGAIAAALQAVAGRDA